MGKRGFVAGASSWRGIAFFRPRIAQWSVVALALLSALLVASPSATAEVPDLVVKEYRQDFDVSVDQAEARLETQTRGTHIVGELKLALGDDYAGVWFDNEANEFVIPLLPDADRAAVDTKLSAKALGGSYRIAPATSTWAELEAEQNKVDRGLGNLLEQGLVQTALDPRSNSVVIREARGASQDQTRGIRQVAQGASTEVDVRERSVERFRIELTACKTSAPRVCDKPLRGGVSIGADATQGGGDGGLSGPCSAAFKAIGKASGNRYLLTAGHCTIAAKNWASYNSNQVEHPIGPVEQTTFPGGDWGKIKANGSYWDTSPWPSQVAHYWENQEQPISYEAYSYLGQYVCHSGASSGTSCAGVLAVGLTSESEAGSVYNVTEFGRVCTAYGDSGGAVFIGSTALGIYHGDPDGLPPQYGGCGGSEDNAFYTEITAATDNLGVTVGTRIGGAPTATTNSASKISAGRATLNGDVNPNTLKTHYYFQYGTTTGYGSNIPIPSGDAGSGTGTVGVNTVLDGLKPNTTYHYRVVASNVAGTSFGSNAQFTTLPPPIPGEDDNVPGPRPVAQYDGDIDVFYRTPSGGLGHNWFSPAPLALGWHKEDLEGSVASGSDPRPILQPDGDIDVFYRTPSGGLGHNWFSPAPQAFGWHKEDLEGSIASGSDPHPVVQPDGDIDVFYRTPSGGLGHNWFSPAPQAFGWHKEDLEGSIASGSDPHPVVQPDGDIDVFYRTPSGGLGHNWYSPAPQAFGWHKEDLEGSVSSDPHAIVQPDGDIDVFYRTPSGGLGHNWYSPAPQAFGWHKEDLEGSVSSDPHAIVQPDGDIDVFYRTPSGGLGHNWFSPAPLAFGWHKEDLSGALVGDPYPVLQADGDIDVFYRTPSGGLGHNWYSPAPQAQGWHLENLEGSIDSSTGMGVHAVAQSDGALDVFYRTPSGGLGHNWLTPSLGWHLENLEGSVSPAAPAATTGATTNLKANEATLNATVNPEGGATSYYFQYGTTTSYGSKKPAVAASIGSGTANVAVAQTATALSANTTYHFRVVAESAGGTTYGADKTFTTAASEYAAAVAADNPVSYWRLGEASGTTAADERGANPGTYTNAPTLGATSLLATDTANKAVSFDGVNDHVKVPSSASLQLTSTLSLEAWIKPTSLPASGTFASILTKPESYSLQFNGPLLEFTIMQSGVRKRLQAPSGTIVAGQTYHVVATYDGTTQRLYVNGTQMASTALSGAATVNTNSLMIGSWNASEEFFKGTIDEPAIYNTVLSGARVAAHYQAANPPPITYSAAVGADNPVSYWRLGEASGTTAADERGANPGTYTNAPTLGATSLLATDTANKAVSFDGVNDHVKVPSSASLQLTSTLSLEAWIKPTSLPASGTFASILTKPESYSLQFNGPLLEFTIMQSGVRKRLQAPSGTIVAGQTYHVVATYDGTTQRLYVNGTQMASTALSGAATVNTNSLMIGSWNASEEFFKGTIDEPAIYNTVLSGARVAAHYQAGSGS